MKTLKTTLCVLFGLALAPSVSEAQRLSLQTSTFARGYLLPGVDDSRLLVPFYQYITLHADELGTPGLSIEGSLWGAIQAADRDLDDNRAIGDVNVLFVRYAPGPKSKARGLELRLGRQFVSVGPALAEHLDGLFASYHLPGGIDVAAFGGAPTGTRFIYQPWAKIDGEFDYGKNWLIGGRLGWHYADIVRLGVAYRHKRYNDELAFDEIAWDAVISPIARLRLLTDGIADMVTTNLKDARAAVAYDVNQAFSGAAGYRYIRPDLYLPRTSIFAVFSDAAHHEGYMEFTFRSDQRRLLITAEMAMLRYEQSCTRGTVTGSTCSPREVELQALLRADAYFGWDRRYRVSVTGQRVGSPQSGMSRVRVAVNGPIWRELRGTIDVDAHVLDRAPGEDNAALNLSTNSRFSLSGSGYLSYPFAHNLSLLAGGQLAHTPLYSEVASFLVRLNWQFDRPKSSGPVKVEKQTRSSLFGAVL
ncbi:MAG: hypothetical protein H6707_09440 [Deltaproteobacteria bacterium]|nr:hypothetical protein [Deltaproteobacteria bacterium]